MDILAENGVYSISTKMLTEEMKQNSLLDILNAGVNEVLGKYEKIADAILDNMIKYINN